MTDQEALIQSIADNPSDNTLRMVYADWLDENACAGRDWFVTHAKLIRCQVEHGNMNGQVKEILLELFPRVFTWVDKRSLWREDFNKQSKLVFDRGFISRMDTYCESPAICTPEMANLVFLNAVVRLYDWRGIACLPQETPRWLKRLELPMARITRSTERAIQERFGNNVEVMIWQDADYQENGRVPTDVAGFLQLADAHISPQYVREVFGLPEPTAREILGFWEPTDD